MSKITNKNFSYNNSLPPFLARLRGEAGGSSYDGPDPILSARRRPVKPRSGSAEAEDMPTVVDAETGEVVSGVSVNDGVVTSLETPLGGGDGGEGEGYEKEEGEGVKKDEGGIGSGKKKEGKSEEGLVRRKRKVGRVVGAEREEDGEGGGEKGVDVGKGQDEGKGMGKSDGKGKSAGKKKAKKIKLSFGDEEG